MYEKFAIVLFFLINVSFEVQGTTCNKPADSVVKFCSGDTLTSSARIYLEADFSPSERITECSCTVTVIQSGSESNSSQMEVGSVGNWSSCDYLLEMNEPSLESNYLDCNKTISTISNADLLNIKLLGDFRNNPVSGCVSLEVIPATNNTQFEVSCPKNPEQTSKPAPEKPHTNVKPTEKETTYNIKKIDVLKMKGEVKYEDKSHIVVPICVGVGTALIVFTVIGVILCHRIKRKNNSEAE